MWYQVLNHYTACFWGAHSCAITELCLQTALCIPDVYRVGFLHDCKCSWCNLFLIICFLNSRVVANHWFHPSARAPLERCGCYMKSDRKHEVWKADRREITKHEANKISPNWPSDAFGTWYGNGGGPAGLVSMARLPWSKRALKKASIFLSFFSKLELFSLWLRMKNMLCWLNLTCVALPHIAISKTWLITTIL